MSILIKGMKMPGDGYHCRFPNGWGDCILRDQSPDQCEFQKSERPEWCPLVEIPPHGRLIDADALWKEIKSKFNGLKLRPKGESYMYDAGFLAGYRAAAQIASKMPTIIPADEEGEQNMRAFQECDSCRLSGDYCDTWIAIHCFGVTNGRDIEVRNCPSYEPESDKEVDDNGT